MGCCYSDQQLPGNQGQFNNCLNGIQNNQNQFVNKDDSFNQKYGTIIGQDIQNHQQYQQYQREYYRRKSQYNGINGGPQIVVTLSNRGEGNSGGIGEGMQYQNTKNKYYGYNEQQINEQFNYNQKVNYQQFADQNDLLNQIDVNEPIEGALISDKEKNTAPMLQIEIMEGRPQLVGQKLIINAQGLVQSMRKKKDGCTIIGSQEKNMITGEHYNDFVISNEIIDNDQNNAQDKQQVLGGIGKRHMVIKYNDVDKKYYLRDLGDGSGTFVRIDNSKDLILKHGFIVSYGDSHMVVQFSSEIRQDDQSIMQKITLKFLDGPKIDNSFTFTEKEKTIMIGRMSQCQIKFDDNSLSRLQCMIEYRIFDPSDSFDYYNSKNIDGQQIPFGQGIWVLRDGDPQKGKKSTNGTWLFVDELFPICNQLVFKAGQTLFKINEISS